jgi:hypothetical protein
LRTLKNVHESEQFHTQEQGCFELVKLSRLVWGQYYGNNIFGRFAAVPVGCNEMKERMSLTLTFDERALYGS